MSQLTIDPISGLIQQARHCPSPNCNDRPDPTQFDLIVIHGISLPPAEFGGRWIDALFTNTLDTDAHPYFRDLKGLQVSSHLLIRRDGEIVQYVPFHRRAWHAGQSNYQGRSQCNDFSIGIELEGTDDQPYETIQYQQLARAIISLIRTYPTLSLDRITGHSDIAPGRKTDPGPFFEWHRLHKLLFNLSKQIPSLP